MSRADGDLHIALTQTPSSSDIAGNLDILLALFDAAAPEVDLVLFPENALFAASQAEMQARPFTEDSAEIRALQQAARQRGTALVLGGVRWRDGDAIANRALVIAADGRIAAWYDKVHGFAARLDGVAFDAARHDRAGDRLVLVDIGGVRVGLSICFDIRFPDMFQQLALGGAEVLLIPSAFTRITGRAHWEILLRARAIETGAYVIASASISDPSVADSDPRACWGHALAVGPWGEILADLGETGHSWQVICVNKQAVADARRRMPALERRRGDVYGRQPFVTTLPPAGKPG